jgi:solute:Na+ symporter, SSS family
MPTAHYFWIRAIPAMFMLRRLSKPAHLANAISVATPQIAGINRYPLVT